MAVYWMFVDHTAYT